MSKIFFGVFLVLHGLVHLLYVGQSQRMFELQPGMVWPDGSWLLSRLLNNETVRWVTAVSLVIAALVFVISAAGLFLGQSWWRWALVGAAAFCMARPGLSRAAGSTGRRRESGRGQRSRWRRAVRRAELGRGAR